MRQKEQGYALIIAIVVLVFLTLLASTTLRTVATDTEVAGSDRSAQSALYIAQAGTAFGVNLLREAPFNLDDPATTVTSVLGAATLTTIADATSPLDGWSELPGSPISFAGGSYRVAIRDDADDTDYATDANNTFLLRSLGTDARGSRRLLEITLSAQ